MKCTLAPRTPTATTAPKVVATNQLKKERRLTGWHIEYRGPSSASDTQSRDAAVQTVPEPIGGIGPPQFRQRTLHECLNRTRSQPNHRPTSPVAYVDPVVPSTGKEFSSHTDGDGPDTAVATSSWKQQLRASFKTRKPDRNQHTGQRT